MAVNNRIRIRLNQIQDGDLNRRLLIPIQTTTDEMGRGDLITDYEEDVIEELLNLKKDYEVTRYTHAPISEDPSPNAFYEFYFGNVTQYPNVSGGGTYTPITIDYALIPTTTTWNSGMNAQCPDNLEGENLEPTPIYNPYDPSDNLTWSGFDYQEFTPTEAYENNKSFVKSFFKLDLYDSPIRAKQKLYISLIINTIKGEKILRPVLKVLCSTTTLDGRWNCVPKGEGYTPTPKFTLDPLENNESYYIYWLKEKGFLDLSTFYMSCKFFNAKTGLVTNFINKPQNELGNKPFTISPEDNYYYRVKLDRDNYTYKVFSTVDNARRGYSDGVNVPIKFYQYFNSP